MTQLEPAYLETHRRGLLQQKIAAAYDILSRCHLCPRNCLVDRHHGERGLCRTGDLPVTSSFGPHFGEEDPLVGSHGSGTIFFTHCNLYCLFCQNYEISHGGAGEEISLADLAAMMLNLQQQGCHNINFVTPSHQVYQILAALPLAIDRGLKVPLVYNTGGYDALETLHLLDGVIDIYMPDFKFWDPQVAAALCQAEDYPETARQALKEMHRQVGDLELDEDGVARRGLLVRHLVLPDGLAGTKEIMEFLAREISLQTYVNVMGQYRPCGRASEHPSLRKFLTVLEHAEAQRLAREAGLTRLDHRDRLFRWLEAGIRDSTGEPGSRPDGSPLAENVSDIYAIGDIHGNLDLLERLLDKLQPDLTRDRLIFMGDYIDRGPRSQGVVDYVLRLRNQAPPEQVICLKGNHEAMFLNFMQGRDIELFLYNGGLSTLRDYWGEDWEDHEVLVLPPDHRRFLEELRLYYETEAYIFVHGGLKPGVPLAEQGEEDLLWIRGDFIASMEDFGKRVIFGHTPFHQPLVMPNKIGIDTGAAYGNRLTCLRLPQEKFISVAHERRDAL